MAVFDTTDCGCGGITLEGLERDCTASGGILRVAVAPACDIASVTTDDSGVVTAIQPTNPANPTPFVEYNVNKRANASTLTVTANVSETSVACNYTSALIFQLIGMSALSTMEFQNLCAGETIALVKTRAGGGRWFMLGVPGDAAYMSAGEGASGAASTDFNGYTVTLQTLSDYPPMEVSAAIAEALIRGGNGSGAFRGYPTTITFTADASDSSAAKSIVLSFVTEDPANNVDIAEPMPTLFTVGSLGTIGNVSGKTVLVYPNTANTGAERRETLTFTPTIAGIEDASQSVRITLIQQGA